MTKEEARATARARLAALSPAERSGGASALERHLWGLPALADATAILLYAALPFEVPTREIAAEARRRGIQVSYPRCLPEGRLALHQVEHDGLLGRGRYGIMEPGTECPLVSAAELDVVLLPGLAWSRDGHRLGRGAGYYDRLLALPEFRAYRCGIFFAAQEMDPLPVDPWDVPLDAVVTENGIVTFESGR